MSTSVGRRVLPGARKRCLCEFQKRSRSNTPEVHTMYFASFLPLAMIHFAQTSPSGCSFE